jgi:hypothetical protein
MNTGWIIAGLGVVGVVAAIVLGRARGRESDLGSVSEHWVAEHRLSQPQDSQR